MTGLQCTCTAQCGWQLTLAWIGSALDGVLWGARLGELGVGTVVRSRRGRGN